MTKIVTYAQANIGRNVGDIPMTEARWMEFQHAVAMRMGIAAMGKDGKPSGPDLSIAVAHDCQFHYGRGMWDGVPEDSAHISIFWEPGLDIDQLRGMLKSLAHKYGQDAIALIAGSELVEA